MMARNSCDLDCGQLQGLGPADALYHAPLQTLGEHILSNPDALNHAPALLQNPGALNHGHLQAPGSANALYYAPALR